MQRMARSARGSDNGELDSGTAARAGAFLEINYAGASKDKRIARDFGCSPSLAKQLRQGRMWTIARFDQLIALWPAARDFIFPPSPDRLGEQLAELAQGFRALAARLGALEEELRTDRRELRADIAALRQDVQNLRA
jgi:hypothetical protein